MDFVGSCDLGGDVMSKTMAEHARAYRTRKAEKMARMEEQNANLRAALSLALSWLIHNEPGDSRGVSDEFVAMASVLDDVMNDEVMPIIHKAIANQK